ncbi:MAG: hypothetical protein JHC88_11230 [Niveispirillum sp.]|nr:hypothetical protein [Niveispirillum sp.]
MRNGDVAACGFDGKGKRLCFSFGEDERVGNHGVLNIQVDVLVGYPMIVTFSHFALMVDGELISTTDPAWLEITGSGHPTPSHQLRWTKALSPEAGGPELLKRLEDSRTITFMVDGLPVITVASDRLGPELKRLDAQRR